MDIEFESVERIREFQEDLLRKQIAYLAAHSPYYQRMFAEQGVAPESIRTIEDLQRLPFTEKADLQRYNSDFLCVPREEIIDYITAGLKKGDILQLMTTIDKRFMAGLAYWMGIRRMGASVIRVGNGIPELQWDTIQRLHPTAIMCVPSFVLRLIEYAEQHNIDYRHSSIRKIIENNEPGQIGSSVRQEFEDVPAQEVHAVLQSVEGGVLLRLFDREVGGVDSGHF